MRKMIRTTISTEFVDDTSVWDIDIEEPFHHTWDNLQLCENNGIRLIKQKSQFYQDTVNFPGFKLTTTGIQPSEKNIIICY